MITNEDVTKLKGVFATKEELRETAADLRVELGELSDKVDIIAATVGRMENKIDAFIGTVEDLRTENAAGAVHLERHDRHIAALAAKTGIALSD